MNENIDEDGEYKLHPELRVIKDRAKVKARVLSRQQLPISSCRDICHPVPHIQARISNN
jgi:hypothetical protein